MNSQELIAFWKQEEQKPFSGWDFSYLEGKLLVEHPPWSYPSRAADLMRGCATVVDMGTGGGEMLLQLKEAWPRKVTATEAYPPNFELATKLLTPFGAQVFSVQLSEGNPMPFADNEFELVLNRHAGFNPAEVARILAPGGIFLTQQVHGLSTDDLLAHFKAKPQYPEATPEKYLPKLKDAGLIVTDMQEWSGKLSFIDVAALVYYLKAIPWVVPGFSVETHLEYLLSLQHRWENGQSLTFTARQYLIEARKLI
jgi:SAM-dependent methyltransferase